MRKARAPWLVLVLVLVLVVVVLLVWPERPPGTTGAWMAEAGLEPRFESLGGVRVRYLRVGAGPALVLLHGFGSSIVTWRDVLPALARTHDVLALDLPGFGASDQPPDLTAELYPRVLIGLLDRAGIARASFVGNSLGGAVAVKLVADSPERAERLVLLDAAGYNLKPADWPFFLRLAVSRPAGVVIDRLPVRRLVVRMGLKQVFHDDSLVTEERVEEYVAPYFRPGSLAAARALLASELRTQDFPGVIARVRVPTLIVWGREDRWIPVRDADRFAAAIPGSRRVILEACGHMPQEERPAEVVRLLEEFLGH